MIARRRGGARAPSPHPPPHVCLVRPPLVSARAAGGGRECRWLPTERWNVAARRHPGEAKAAAAAHAHPPRMPLGLLPRRPPRPATPTPLSGDGGGPALHASGTARHEFGAVLHRRSECARARAQLSRDGAPRRRCA
eukprot:scaffold2408_cov386-Prasinococcus_capsulatus_cf.AAC.1